MNITGKRRLFLHNTDPNERNIESMKSVTHDSTSTHNYSQPAHNKRQPRKNKYKGLQLSDKSSIASLYKS